MRHPLATLVVVGLAIRLVVAPFTAWTGDVDYFYWSVLDLLGGKDPYHSMFYSYPPGWAATLALPFLLLTAFVPPQSLAVFVPSMVPLGRLSPVVIPVVTSPLFNLTLKLPLILGDLFTGWLMYRLVSSARDATVAKRAFAVWFLNPLVILIGSVDGQFDVLPSLFVVAGLNFLLKREYVSSGVALAVSAYFKIFAVYLVPVYLILLLGKAGNVAPPPWSKRPAVRFAGGAAAAGGFLAALFPWGDGLNALLRRVSTSTFGGFTPLAVLYFPNPQDLTTGLTLVNILVPFAVVVPLVFLFRKRASGTVGISLAALAALTTATLVVLFAVTPLVNPQYLLWILPSLILLRYATDRGAWFVPAITLAGVAATIAIAGPLAFFYPGAVWTGWPSVSVINESIFNFWRTPGALGVPAAILVFLLISLVGFGILGVQAYTALEQLWRHPDG